MLLLILGLALWVLAHIFKRIAPDRRAALGDPGKELFAAGIGIGVVLMVVGYRHGVCAPLDSAQLGRRRQQLPNVLSHRALRRGLLQGQRVLPLSPSDAAGPHHMGDLAFAVERRSRLAHSL